ncbi:sigma-54-dependent Fis family transcriptional regulator [Nonomuraea sp. NPDC050547]|uniref:sigma-54-dependent Fis family transcriptional regulator n=1 Tax=Nonomuraea sp. NPDC050547 TaxID=3364368 RepID=UPI0037B863F7
MAGLRPDIARSWRRAALSGLDPGSGVAGERLEEVDSGSRLMVAAKPVLDAVAEQLRNTRFSVLLADGEGRIVDRRLGDPRLADALDEVFAVPGCRYTEDVAGTNALATAFELRRGVSVVGPEHFLERLKGFCCYGHPVTHPVTGRLEGVLDVTGLARDATGLLEPFLAQAVRGIEQRLIEGSRLSDQRMLAAFRARTARTGAPVIVVGDGITMANRAAHETFDAAILRELGRELTGDHGVCLLHSRAGIPVRARYSVVPGAVRAVLFEAIDTGRAQPVVPRTRATEGTADPLEPFRRRRRRLLIHGEPGSGRTYAAHALAGDHPSTVLDAASLSAGDITSALDRGPDHLVVIDGIHLLDDPTAATLAHLLDGTTGWYALTSGPVEELTGERIGPAARCASRWETIPLRSRRHDIPALARALLKGHGSTTHLTPAALDALSRHTWPGNLAELSAVMAELARRTEAGVITELDLPTTFRRPRRRLSALEQAEFDTIRSVLDRCRGNKVHAAAMLGIARTTLYRRLKELGLG